MPSEKESRFTASLAEMEPDFHYQYSYERLERGGYNGKDPSHLMKELDDYCDIDKMHQKQGPMLILGESGSGKSSLCANWILNRQRHAQTWSSAFPEFVHYHCVGCTRQSTFISKLLNRLLLELKDFFELQKEIPYNEERLTWQFPRFLEAASRKGRVVIVIDGIQRLQTNDGEGILRWLPLSFPPNVRIIFTGTLSRNSVVSINSAGEFEVVRHQNGGKQHNHNNVTTRSVIDRIQIEANRRNWRVLMSYSLTTVERREVVQSFLLKKAGDLESEDVDDYKTKFTLLPIQAEAIAQVRQTSNPRFLITLLNGLAWAAEAGYDVNVVLKEWISTESPSALAEAIIRSMDDGYTPSAESIAEAKTFIVENGIQSLSQLRPSTSSNVLTSRGGNTTTSGSTSVVAAATTTTAVALIEGNSSDASDELEEEADVQHEADDDEYGDDDFEDDAFEYDEDTSSPTENTTTCPSESVIQDDEPLSAESLQPQASSLVQPESEQLRPVSDNANNSTNTTTTIDTVRGGKTATVTLNSVTAANYPLYMLGGSSVAPLRGVLGKALALLYVSRHGLHVTELHKILDRELDNTTDDEVKTLDLNTLALSPGTWKRLTVVLRKLGIMFHQNVFVMPFCAEALRELVWWRYIGSDAEEQRYHQVLIQYFLSQPKNFRRAEELPWHLNCCFKWTALKEQLTDINMFRLLFTMSFKTELFSYWQVLSGTGNLTLTKKNAAGVDEVTTIAPFDLVRECGKGVDEWYAATRPSTTSLTALLNVYSQFIHEYCCYTQTPCPEFDHPKMDYSALEAQGIKMPPTPVQNIPCESKLMYSFMRWKWIQFPWIALTFDLELSENEGAAVTRHALAKKDRALKLRKNSLADQTSWDMTKKELLETQSNKKVGNKALQDIISSSSSSVSKSASKSAIDILDPGTTLNQRMRRSSTVGALHQASRTIRSLQQKQPSSKLLAVPETVSLPTLTKSKSTAATRRKQSVFDAVATSTTSSVVKNAVKKAPDATPGPSEWEMKKSFNHEILYKLKNAYNEATIAKKEKQKLSKKLRNELKELLHVRATISKQLKEGEEAMDAMLKRSEKIEQTISKVELDGALMSRIINVCESYPPGNKAFLNDSRKKLRILELRVSDQEQRHQSLKFANQRVINNEIPALHAEHQKAKRLYNDIVSNIQATHERIKTEKETEEALYRKRRGIIQAVKLNAVDLSDAEEAQLSNAVKTHEKKKEAMAHEAEVLKSALVQCEVLCQNIKNATGMSQLDVIYDKFINREELNQSLVEQMELYEARLSIMRADQQVIENELNELRLQNALFKAEDSRLLEASLREAESRRSRAKTDFSATDAQFKELMIGVAQVAKLLGITSLHTPRESLIPAPELWPPAHTSTLASELALASITEIEAVLQVCEERAISINETLEHGRGDPDARFETKSRRRSTLLSIHSDKKSAAGKISKLRHLQEESIKFEKQQQQLQLSDDKKAARNVINREEEKEEDDGIPSRLDIKLTSKKNILSRKKSSIDPPTSNNNTETLVSQE